MERAAKGFACGLGAFTAVMWASRELGADKVQVLRYAASADVTEDYSPVVGYAAAVILKAFKSHPILVPTCIQEFSRYNHLNDRLRSNRRQRPCCFGDF